MLTLVILTGIVTFISMMLYRSNVLIYSDAGILKTVQTSIRNTKNDKAARKN